MDPRVRLPAALALIVACGLVATPRVAGALAVVFSDATFLDNEWTTTVIPSGLGGTGTAGQTATGGNPGPFREISLTVVEPSSTGSRVDVVSIKPSAVYDPGVQAAIASIDYSEDAILLSGSGNGHGLTIALEQGG